MEAKKVKEDDMEVALTKKELVMMLDAKIQRKAGWALRGDDATYGSLGIASLDDEAVGKVAAEVYKDIVADFSYDGNIVKATRAVKFNSAYVRKVIKAGLKDGSVKLEAETARRVESAVERLEGLPPWLKKKVKGKEKDGDEDGKGKKKKKGKEKDGDGKKPPWLKK